MRVRASRFRPFFSTVSHSRFHRPAGGSFSWSGARGARGVGGRGCGFALCETHKLRMRAQPDAVADAGSFAAPKSCPHDAVAHGEPDADAFSRPDGGADFGSYS